MPTRWLCENPSQPQLFFWKNKNEEILHELTHSNLKKYYTPFGNMSANVSEVLYFQLNFSVTRTNRRIDQTAGLWDPVSAAGRQTDVERHTNIARKFKRRILDSVVFELGINTIPRSHSASLWQLIYWEYNAILHKLTKLVELAVRWTKRIWCFQIGFCTGRGDFENGCQIEDLGNWEKPSLDVDSFPSPQKNCWIEETLESTDSYVRKAIRRNFATAGLIPECGVIHFLKRLNEI